MIIQIILVVILFLAIKWFAWNFTERRWGIPEWLDYQPYNCFKCFSFWSLLSTYLAIELLFEVYIFMGIGLGLTVLDTIAYIIHEKNNTISIEDFGN